LSSYSQEYMNKLLIYYLKEEDSGSYECFLSNGQSSEIRLVVKRVNRAENEQEEQQLSNNYHSNNNQHANENRNQYENHNHPSHHEQESIKLA